MKKNILKCLSILVLTGSIFTMASCGEKPSNSSVDTPATSAPATSEATSNIKEIKATVEKIEMKVGKGGSIKDYYEIIGANGKKITTGTDSRCTYATSDASIVKLTGSSGITPVSAGEATITITSKSDNTKTCTIPVVVKEAFFDFNLSKSDGLDLTKEHPNDGGIVTETGDYGTNILVKGVDSTKWYAECTFSLNSVLSTETYPKVGIFTSTQDKTNPANNQLYFFLDAWIGDNNNSTWTNYGVCEVENEGNWAWNPGVGNATARHKDNGYTGTAVTYGTEFTLGLLRDGLDFHCYVGGEYRFSLTTLDSLFKNGDDVATSMVGFFDFNSSVTYSKYSATADEAKVNEKLGAISSKKYIGSEGFEWAAD